MHMRISVKQAMIMGLCLALAGCGDGGGSGGGGGVASTPGPTYQTLAQVVQTGGNRTFQAAATQNTYTQRPYAGGTIYFATGMSTLAYGQGITIAYTASTDSYQLTAPDGTTATFGAADVNTAASSGTTTVWSKTLASGGRQNFSLTIPQLNGVALSYTMVGNWSQFDGVGSPQSYSYLANGGIPTLASDMPRTGSANYTVAVGGSLSDAATSAVYSLNANSSATFSANFAANTVSTNLNLVGVQTLPTPTVTPPPATPFGSFNGSGTIAANSPGFTGTFGTSGGFSGTFNGPQAAEVGYSWFINSGNIQAVGQVYGKKN